MDKGAATVTVRGLKDRPLHELKIVDHPRKDIGIDTARPEGGCNLTEISLENFQRERTTDLTIPRASKL